MTHRIFLLSLGVCLAACPRPGGSTTVNGKPRVEAKSDKRADAALADAVHLQDTKGRKAAVEAYLSVRKAFPETTAGQEALYRAGIAAYEEGDYATARRSLDELIFENPLYPQADQARLTSALAALELKQYRDAYQALQSLVDTLSGPDKRRAEEALARAAAGAKQYGDALKLALKKVDDTSGAERDEALKALEDVVETKANFLSVAEAYQGLSPGHPAWPLLTFKLSRIYFHLRDWQRLDETLRSLLREAPGSPWAAPARQMLERTARRFEVKPKVVGAVLPLSGKYKALGEAVMRGLTLALKGSDVELIAKDSQGDVNLAGKLVEELALDEGAIAIVGPLLSDDARRAALVAEELQVPIISLSRAEGLTAIGPHVFRNMLTNQQQADALAEYATKALGFKSFGVLYPNIPFGVEVANDFWDAVEKRGGTLRAAETYDHDQTTFTSEAKRLVGRYYMEDRGDYLEKLRELREQGLDDYHRRKALEKVKKDLPPVIDFEALLIADSWQRVSLVAPALAVEDIITNACDKKDLEKIQKTTGQDKLKTVVLLGPSTWSSPKSRTVDDYELVVRGGKFVHCSVYVDGFYEGSSRKATKVFVDLFHDANKDVQPSLLDAVGFDTGGMLKLLLDTKAPKSRAELREQLAGLHDYDGATGLTRFDEKREAVKPLFMLTIDPKGIKELPPVVAGKPQG